jgi:hypothetical protein
MKRVLITGIFSAALVAACMFYNAHKHVYSLAFYSAGTTYTPLFAVGKGAFFQFGLEEQRTRFDSNGFVSRDFTVPAHHERIATDICLGQKRMVINEPPGVVEIGLVLLVSCFSAVCGGTSSWLWSKEDAKD